MLPQVRERRLGRVQRLGHDGRDQEDEAAEDEQDVQDAAGVGDAVEELGHGNLRRTGRDRDERAADHPAASPRDRVRIHPEVERGPPAEDAERSRTALVPRMAPRPTRSGHRLRRRFRRADVLAVLFGEGLAAASDTDHRRAALVGRPADAGAVGRPAVAAQQPARHGDRRLGADRPARAVHRRGRQGPLRRLARMGEPVRAGRLRVAPAARDRPRRRRRLPRRPRASTTRTPGGAGAEGPGSAAWWDLVPVRRPADRRRRRGIASRPHAGHREGAGRGRGAGGRRRGAGADRPRAARRRHPPHQPRRPPGRWRPPGCSTATRSASGSRCG